MSVSAMGLTALLVLFILVIFYSGSLLSLYPLKALQFVGCAGLAVAALLYVIGSSQSPLHFLMKLLLYEGIYVCICRTAVYMFLNRHYITCYTIPLAGAFMVFLLPAFFGREGQGSLTIPVRISVLIPLLGVFAGFLFMVRQIRRKEFIDWIISLAVMAAACLLCRELLPALITVCAVYAIEMIRRPSVKTAAALGFSIIAAVLIAVLFKYGRIPSAIRGLSPDLSLLPSIQDAVISFRVFVVFTVFVFICTVMFPFLRFFVMKRIIGSSELYPLIFAVISMLLYIYRSGSSSSEGISASAAVFLANMIPLASASLGILYEKCEEDFRLFGRLQDDDLPEADSADPKEDDSETDPNGLLMEYPEPDSSEYGFELVNIGIEDEDGEEDTFRFEEE